MTSTGLLADPPEARKARGAFFTPAPLARYIVSWAVRNPTDVVLEPSCGEAVFLLAAGDRLRRLNKGRDPGQRQLLGTEIHTASAETATALLREAGLRADVRVCDFLARPAVPTHDVVVGNPPYVRYQDFSGGARATAREAALRAGVALNNLASSWAAFTVHAAESVRPSGRLGLVLPAELLAVNYASPVRDYLMRSFSRVRLVLFHERVFPGVNEEVVLLLAEGRGERPAPYCELLQLPDLNGLESVTEAEVTRWEPGSRTRWSELHLDPHAASAYRVATAEGDFVPLQVWGETSLGAVTGNNAYFAISGDAAQRLGIPREDLLRISPPGSRHLRGLTLSRSGLDKLDLSGRQTWLFRPPSTPGRESQRYIEAGLDAGVHTAYKCRVRNPWWRVPTLSPPDMLLTYMNADAPRLCANRAAARHLNSVHGVYLRSELRRLGRDLLPLATLNSATLLGAELVGRSYGGGILKLEPREADVWPVPAPALIARAATDLRRARQRVTRLLLAGRLGDAVSVVDTVLGRHTHALNEDSASTLRSAREQLSRRRSARGPRRLVGDYSAAVADLASPATGLAMEVHGTAVQDP